MFLFNVLNVFYCNCMLCIALYLWILIIFKFDCNIYLIFVLFNFFVAIKNRQYRKTNDFFASNLAIVYRRLFWDTLYKYIDRRTTSHAPPPRSPSQRVPPKPIRVCKSTENRRSLVVRRQKRKCAPAVMQLATENYIYIYIYSEG